MEVTWERGYGQVCTIVQDGMYRGGRGKAGWGMLFLLLLFLVYYVIIQISVVISKKVSTTISNLTRSMERRTFTFCRPQTVDHQQLTADCDQTTVAGDRRIQEADTRRPTEVYLLTSIRQIEGR